MATARDLVYDAMASIGAYGTDEAAPKDADAQLVLRRLNRLLSSWSNDNLNIYEVYTDSLTLTPGVSAYSTALLSQGRPVTVDDMYVRYANIDYPITQINVEDWSDIGYKSTTSIPTKCYVDTGWPNTTLNLFPIPFTTTTLFVNGMRLVPAAWTLDTTVSLPPGYERFICDNLAVDIASSFGKTPSDDLRASAIKSHGIVKRQNAMPRVLKSETPLGQGLFNIYRGQ